MADGERILSSHAEVGRKLRNRLACLSCRIGRLEPCSRPSRGQYSLSISQIDRIYRKENTGEIRVTLEAARTRASLFPLSRFIQLGFGRLQVSTFGFPQPTRVTREVELELEAFAASHDGARALADLLDTWSDAPRVLIERALRALESGRLQYEAWAPVVQVTGRPPQADWLAALAGDEPTEIPVHAVVLELVDLRDRPVAGAQYHLVDPEGRAHRGILDHEGRAEIREIRKSGACKVSFPEFDSRAWTYVSAHPL